MAYLSGQCCCIRLSFVALCTSGSAFFVQSETVAIVTCTCWWDGGKIASARDCRAGPSDLQMTEVSERTVSLGPLLLCAVLQRSSWPLHTRVSFSHTMGALCSAIIPETNTVAMVCDTLLVVESLTSANQQGALGKSTSLLRRPCRWQRSTKRKTLYTCGETKSIAIRRD